MSASCCRFDRRNIAIGVLSLLLVLAVAGWVREATKPTPTNPAESVPPIEMVEVLVAAKDLTTGTAFNKDTVDQLTEFRRVPKDSVPPEAKLIQSRGDLIGKRLTRPLRQGEVLSVADVALRQSLWMQGPRDDIISLPLTRSGNRGYIGRGSRVDILAGWTDGMTREVFTLLSDMTVLEVNASSDHTELPFVSFVVDQKQAMIIALANQANCNMEFLLQDRDAPKRDQDYDKTLTRIKELVQKREAREPVLAPPPREKV